MCIFEHSWKAKSVYNYQSKPVWQQEDFWTEKTKVLFVCQDCGEVKTESVEGKWKLEYFNKN